MTMTWLEEIKKRVSQPTTLQEDERDRLALIRWCEAAVALLSLMHHSKSSVWCPACKCAKQHGHLALLTWNPFDEIILPPDDKEARP